MDDKDFYALSRMGFVQRVSRLSTMLVSLVGLMMTTVSLVVSFVTQESNTREYVSIDVASIRIIQENIIDSKRIMHELGWKILNNESMTASDKANFGQLSINLNSIEASLYRKQNNAWLDIGIIRSAYAQDFSHDKSRQAIINDDFKRYLLVFIVAAITLFGGFCLFLYFTTQHEEKMKFADNMLRTIVGFYIGIVTGLLGLS